MAVLAAIGPYVAVIGTGIAAWYTGKEVIAVQNPNVPMGDHQAGRQFTIGSNGMPSLNPYYVPPSAVKRSTRLPRLRADLARLRLRLRRWAGPRKSKTSLRRSTARAIPFPC